MNLMPACGRSFYGGNMPVLISGVLKDATGNAGTELHHSAEGLPVGTTVVVNTVASENRTSAGRYSMDVEQGAVHGRAHGGRNFVHAGVITDT